jgi:hypothetical protein
MGQPRKSRDALPEDGKQDRPDRAVPPPVKIQPVKKRVGEGRDNLRRRSSWFRKRSSDAD